MRRVVSRRHEKALFDRLVATQERMIAAILALLNIVS